MRTTHFIAGLLLLSILLLPACTVKTKPDQQSTISVNGIGTVAAQPDIMQLSITLSNVSKTTKAAQDEVSKKVKQVLSILKEEKIEDKYITTASLNFRSEYEYTQYRRVLVGQRAEQVISFTIDEINNDNERAPRIIDKLITINGIELNQINFSIKNNTEYFTKSRDLAYQKAYDKASQYAKLANLKIVKVLNLSEEGNQYFEPISNRYARNQLMEAETIMDVGGSTVLPTGDLEITTRVSVVFLVK
jgi:uncharacterized protein YggE